MNDLLSLAANYATNNQSFFEEGKFIPSEPVKIQEHKKAIITILDENTEY